MLFQMARGRMGVLFSELWRWIQDSSSLLCRGGKQYSNQGKYFEAPHIFLDTFTNIQFLLNWVVHIVFGFLYHFIINLNDIKKHSFQTVGQSSSCMSLCLLVWFGITSQVRYIIYPVTLSVWCETMVLLVRNKTYTRVSSCDHILVIMYWNINFVQSHILNGSCSNKIANVQLSYA